MMKFDHLNIPVSNLDRSRDWYMSALGLKAEFEVPDRRTVALQDGEGFAIFLQEKSAGVAPNGVALWFQVDDVDQAFAAWTARSTSSADARGTSAMVSPEPPKSSGKSLSLGRPSFMGSTVDS